VLYRGRFGPYLKHGRQIASLPRGRDADSLTVEEGVKLLQEKAAKGKGKATAGTRRTATKATGRPGRTAGKSAGRATKS
jgi:DNA topoisomerase-1